MDEEDIIFSHKSFDTNAYGFVQAQFVNLYRITVRDQGGKISGHEVSAPNMQEAVRDACGTCELIKIERIHPGTGEVLGGFYNE